MSEYKYTLEKLLDVCGRCQKELGEALAKEIDREILDGISQPELKCICPPQVRFAHCKKCFPDG